MICNFIVKLKNVFGNIYAQKFDSLPLNLIFNLRLQTWSFYRDFNSWHASSSSRSLLLILSSQEVFLEWAKQRKMKLNNAHASTCHKNVNWNIKKSFLKSLSILFLFLVMHWAAMLR